MPNVELDSEANGRLTDDAVVKVSVEGLTEGANSWFLSEGESIAISADEPNHVEVEAIE